ncbi:MAG: hypothetical protein HY902_05175 [Deltaproteobacteria bacterium]|nr:hypothetical protein [Deltaproteobacteria bacterium]
MSIDTLAKVDLYCVFDSAIHPSVLARWAARKGEPSPSPSELDTAYRVETMAQIPERRAWVRGLLQSAEDLTEAALDLARRLIAEVVVHVEWVVDLNILQLEGLSPADVLIALDAGCNEAVTERDDVFLSWSFLVQFPEPCGHDEAQALVRSLATNPDVQHLGGFVVPADGRPLDWVIGAFEACKELSLGRVVVAGDQRDAARVLSAIELGAQRIVGGTSALGREDILLQLRAHRVPVVALPSAQVLGGVAPRGWPSLPLKKMKEGGLFTVLGSGWPTWLGSTLTAELEQVSKHLHWRLDDLRNVTTRGVEAGFMAPNLRFSLARTVEIWRHRPLVQAQVKGGDPFAL